MPATPLTLRDLEADLWRCAQILRGSAIDRTDWKAWILPLLFFKRISDVWDEETAEARAEYGDVELDLFPELHRFTLPDGCHWRDVRAAPANVGAALARAMRTIERPIPTPWRASSARPTGATANCSATCCSRTSSRGCPACPWATRRSGPTSSATPTST